MPRPEPYENLEERRTEALRLAEEFRQRSEAEGMQQIFSEIENAVHRLGLPETAFTKVDPEEARSVTEAARRALVVGNPLFWWDSLRHPASSHLYPEGGGYRYVAHHIPSGQRRCWLIVEIGAEQYPVYAVDVEHVPEVLDECYGFDYYLVGMNFDWFVAESDHNVVYVSPPQPE